MNEFSEYPTSISLAAPAKINLFLHVLGQRPDGYHLLESVMTPISLQDHLTLQRLEEPNIILETPLANVPAEQDLTVRAARLLQQSTQCQYGVSIRLQKNIPMGAGLGGGSSDAASVLLGLNQLWGLHLSIADLQKLALQLGADVPFFLLRKPAFLEGIGEILTPMSLPKLWFVLIQPPIAISTADIFRHPHLTRSTKPAKIPAFLDVEGYGVNDLEPIVLAQYPEAKTMVEAAQAHGWRAQMTGSGSCFYIPFQEQAGASYAARQMADTDVLGKNYKIRVVFSVDHVD